MVWPEKQAIDTVHAALDCGMTFIDTAEAYGSMLGASGNSEEILGKALKGRRHQVFLATKVSGGDNSIEQISRAIENSLRLLQTDYVDLYQLHGSDSNYPIEKSMKGLVRLKEAGKIRYIGVSNFSAQQISQAIKVTHVDSNQPRYHMLYRMLEESILPFCLKNGVGVIGHSTLAKGLLTGKYRPGHQFAPDDERSNPAIAPFHGVGLARTLAVADKLERWAESRGRSLVQLAIAWVIANPAITSAIVGAKTPEQVLHNAQAADWLLTPEDLQELDDLQGGFIFGGKGYTLPE